MILVIDNYDSFTYNLVQYLGQCGAEVKVRRNDQISLPQIADLDPDGIMMSPGPCTPKESGICVDLARAYLDSEAAPSKRAGADPSLRRIVPLFGVCLGHQTLAYVAGATVDRADRIMHGKPSPIRHDGLELFHGMPNPFSAIRYHSLVVKRDGLPDDFLVSATSEDDGEIMGIRHRRLPIEGVQFHPESVLTESGFDIVRNFVRQVGLG